MATDPFENAFVGWAERDGNDLTVLVSRYDCVTDIWSESVRLATGTLDARSTLSDYSTLTAKLSTFKPETGFQISKPKNTSVSNRSEVNCPERVVASSKNTFRSPLKDPTSLVAT